MEKTFVCHDSIEGFSGEISKYLHSLLVSINNVDSSYIHYDGNNNDKDFEHVERVFAYEFYRQWCEHPIIKNNKYLVVNAEIPKHLISEARNAKIPLMYPDIVLHHGQNDYKGNLIVCEIKRAGYAKQHPDKIADDFIKLSIYLSEELKVKANHQDWEPFKIGVFIMTEDKNSIIPLSVQTIKTYLKQFIETIENIENEIKKRIFCVVYNGKELKYDTLYNMTNER